MSLPRAVIATTIRSQARTLASFTPSPSSFAAAGMSRPTNGSTTTPNPKPPVPQAFRPPPPSSYYPSQPSSTFSPAPQGFTSTSFGSGWQGSVLSTWGEYGATQGDTSRMQATESQSAPGWDTARQIAALQVKLDRALGPEFISQRSGQGGTKFTYIEGWKVINIANEIFGFNGWSSSILALDTDFIDSTPDGKHSVGITARVRVTLRDGVFHEDVGYGSINNMKDKAGAFEKCKKEAVTDALKRALRNFGNVLGNCLYDKSYESNIRKVKNPAQKFDEKQLYRRPENDLYNSRAGIVTDPTGHSQPDPFGLPSVLNGSPAPRQPTNGGGGAGPSNLARTAMTNNQNHQQQRLGTNATAGPSKFNRPPPVQPPTGARGLSTTTTMAARQAETSFAGSSQPEGLSEMDLSGVDLDAGSYSGGDVSMLDSSTSVRTAPAQPAPPAATPQTTTPHLATSAAPPPPQPQAAPRHPVGGFSFPVPALAAGQSVSVGGGGPTSSSEKEGEGPPPGVSLGAWKRQQSVKNMNIASKGQTRPASDELESIGSALNVFGTSSAKRAKIEYGGNAV